MIRNNNFNQPTCGFAKDYIQTNLVIVTNDYADDFEKFCSLNPKPCPIIEKLDSKCAQYHKIKLKKV